MAINGCPIRDVLDYRYYMTDERLELELLREGIPLRVIIEKDTYDDLGLEFESYLMDKQHHCSNHCVFCFVDQLPAGLRPSLYFKDDDSRMSFLTGSYVTLTNMADQDIQRIIKMKLSPINISVHTTNPHLRVKMLKNPRAADSLRYLALLADAGIKINAQIVVCPGLNDGQELERTLDDLSALIPALQSIAVVPVGLTKHRQGLYPLKPMTAAQAQQTLDIVERFGQRMLQKQGGRVAFAADELFLIAGLPIPPTSYYEDFDQLEDGVGTLALLRDEFLQALEELPPESHADELSIATGTAAAPMLQSLMQSLQAKFPALRVRVYGVENRLFGDTVTVAGLLCGQDLLAGLRDKPLGSRLLLPSVMLRHEGDLFLDDRSPQWLSQQLGVPVTTHDTDGGLLLQAILGQ